ncbi:MAG: hydantoinase/oxoprolinase family protein [Burkholderiaceae bacterium]
MTTAATAKRYRIGVDIGGTFTDFVLLDQHTGALHNEKRLTTPDDPSRAVIEGVTRLMADHQIGAHEVGQVIHGTTLVANALIERKGVRVALITTAGFRDVPEIGLEWRYDTYDLTMTLPPPLAPSERCFEVSERIGPSGQVIEALDEASVRSVAQALKSADVQAVGVCLLHAYQAPSHEQRVGEILAEGAPDVVYCLSSDVVPEVGEYERMSTTLANAYVLPIFQRYLKRITAGLRSLGIETPLMLTLSDGGTVHESTAIRHPVRLVQSGPAGGVQATSLHGSRAGFDDVFCFDMGGTTAKACLIDKGEPMLGNDFEVARVFRFKKGSGLPLKIPVIDMIEIGAGGGSIARIDQLGLLQVGPDSASADPGPACYGRGGTLPTITDADLVLGYLGTDSFLGGDMTLDLSAAREAIKQFVAEPLGLTVEAAAWGIHDLVNENMARASSIHALEKARRISDYTMLPIGGAGPVHAAHVAAKLGLKQVLCPAGAGVASAFGFLAAPTSFAFSRGWVQALCAIRFEEVSELIESLAQEGQALLDTANASGERSLRIAAAMRYVGQGYEIDVPLEQAMVNAADADAITTAFESVYRHHFGRVEADRAIEIVSWRVVVSGPRQWREASDAADKTDAVPRPSTRRAWFDDSWHEAAVYQRDQLGPGFQAQGPAIFEERETTVILPPGASLLVDELANLLLTLPDDNS